MVVLLESDSLIQFLIGTHIRTTVFKNDTVDLIMYESMPNAKHIYENIKKSGLYRNCYLVTSVLAVGSTKLNRSDKIKKGIRWIEALIDPEKAVKKNIGNNDYKYDYFVFCANGIFIDAFYNVCKKSNPGMVCCRYEGSLTSYLYDHENKKSFWREKFETAIKRIFNHFDLTKAAKTYYFFEPELIQFKHNYNLYKIQKITSMSTDIKEKLKKIFEFEAEDAQIEEPVIAFEDGNLFFMNNDEEIPLYTKAANILGKENFIVKLHPRTPSSRFDNHIIKTKKSIAPWELYLINQDMSGKIFITCASGSIFTTLVYFGMDVKVILLYRCLKEKIPLINNNFNDLISLINQKTGHSVLIPKDINEYNDILNYIKGNLQK